MWPSDLVIIWKKKEAKWITTVQAAEIIIPPAITTILSQMTAKCSSRNSIWWVFNYFKILLKFSRKSVKQFQYTLTNMWHNPIYCKLCHDFSNSIKLKKNGFSLLNKREKLLRFPYFCNFLIKLNKFTAAIV